MRAPTTAAEISVWASGGGGDTGGGRLNHSAQPDFSICGMCIHI
jgi:hypothetical protein